VMYCTAIRWYPCGIWPDLWLVAWKLFVTWSRMHANEICGDLQATFGASWLMRMPDGTISRMGHHSKSVVLLFLVEAGVSLVGTYR
jgi:hypothetical protein